MKINNNKPVRVLHVLNGLNVGGMEIFVMNYYRSIEKELVQFDFFVFDKEKDFFCNEIISLGGNVYFAENTMIKNKYVKMLYHVWLLYSFLRKNKYSVVHCHGCDSLGILQGVIASRISNVKKIIAHAHSASPTNGGKLTKLLYKIVRKMISLCATSYFACSVGAAESKFTNDLCENNRINYVSNAIDLNKFAFDNSTRERLRRELNINQQTFVIGTIGRLEKEKNHMFLLKVYREFKNQYNDSKLVLVGNGSLLESLKKEAIDIENVIFTGNVSNPQDYYSVFDCFVLPSLYEGLPFVMVEAQTSGLPCLVSENVSDEACLLESTIKLSIDNDYKCWVDELIALTNKKTYDRSFSLPVLQKKGFDLSAETEKLTNFYLDGGNSRD